MYFDSPPLLPAPLQVLHTIWFVFLGFPHYPLPHLPGLFPYCLPWRCLPSFPHVTPSLAPPPLPLCHYTHTPPCLTPSVPTFHSFLALQFTVHCVLASPYLLGSSPCPIHPSCCGVLPSLHTLPGDGPLSPSSLPVWFLFAVPFVYRFISRIPHASMPASVPTVPQFFCSTPHVAVVLFCHAALCTKTVCPRLTQVLYLYTYLPIPQDRFPHLLHTASSSHAPTCLGATTTTHLPCAPPLLPPAFLPLPCLPPPPSTSCSTPVLGPCHAHHALALPACPPQPA